MPKLSQDDKEKIVALNTFIEGNPILFALHEADRTRKYQRLVASATQGNIYIAGIGNVFGANVAMRGCTVNGLPVDLLHFGPTVLEVGQWRPIASGMGVQPLVSPMVTVVYQEPDEIAGSSVVDTLLEFQRCVQDVIGLFD